MEDPFFNVGCLLMIYQRWMLIDIIEKSPLFPHCQYKLQRLVFRFVIGSIWVASKMAPLNVDGAICLYIIRGPSAVRTGRRDANVTFSRKEVRPFGATSGESLAEYFCSQIAINKVVTLRIVVIGFVCRSYKITNELNIR